MSGFRAAPVSATFAGQSHNRDPSDSDNYPIALMADYPTIPFRNVAQLGVTLADLAESAAGLLYPHATTADLTILLISQGTNDIFDGLSGADLYAAHVTYADNARAAGFGHIIGLTLVGNQFNTAPMNTARTDFNTLLKADASTAFDQVVDLDATALADWTDTTYYNADLLHWKTAGADLCATTVKPAFDAALA